MCHTVCLPLAPPCSRRTWPSPQPASTGSIYPANKRKSGDESRRKRHGGGVATHLLPLLELREHDDGMTLPLPHHPPEVLHRVRQRALRGDVVVLLPVALKGAANTSLLSVEVKRFMESEPIALIQPLCSHCQSVCKPSLCDVTRGGEGVKVFS